MGGFILIFSIICLCFGNDLNRTNRKLREKIDHISTEKDGWVKYVLLTALTCNEINRKRKKLRTFIILLLIVFSFVFGLDRLYCEKKRFRKRDCLYDIRKYFGFSEKELFDCSLKRDASYQQSLFVYPAHLELYFNEARQSGRTAHSDLMKYEWARYESFKDFPAESPAMPSRLASAGFHHVGPSDAVQCFSCKLTYSAWKREDNPVDIHRRYSPRCEFLQTGETNVSIHEDTEQNRPLSIEQGETRSDTLSWGAKGHQKGENDHLSSSLYRTKCKHPQYIELKVRLSSFSKWYRADIQDPRDLAEAGYFYAGT